MDLPFTIICIPNSCEIPCSTLTCQWTIHMFVLELSEDFHYYVSMSDYWKVETQRCQFDEVSLIWAEHIEEMVFKFS